MSVFFLVLSASYFAMPQFRQALETPFLLRQLDTGDIRFARLPQLQQWKTDAESRHDARMLAFVALNTSDVSEATRLTDLAVAADAKYGWVYYHIFGHGMNRKLPEAAALAKKIQAFDPDNAVGYLMEAEQIRENDPAFKTWLSNVKPSYEQRFAQLDWRQAMEKAFAAKKYDAYSIARFDLERHVLHEKRLDRKRWWRAHNKGPIYGDLTIAENYFPILLFIFSTGLYISYYPYARNYQHYMTAVGDMHDLESLFYNTISLPVVMPRFMQLSVGNPFVPYVWFALGAIAIVVAAHFILPERKPAEDPKPAPAAFGN
jgi:hypothetical protein